MTTRLDYESAAPGGVRALGSVYLYIGKSGLASNLLNLVFLRVSQINGCAYCIDLHFRDALKDGIALDKLVLVAAWRETAQLFSDRERAALQWAESITLIAHTGAPDADYAAIAAQFDAKELADLTVAIGLINVYNRIAIGFRRLPASLAPR